MISSIIGGAAACAGLEAAMRTIYRKRYSIPYKPRIYGDYKYREFIEKAPLPLGNRMKPGYRSRCVNLNRFGLRGSEPGEKGERKRVLVIGESEIFGVKLNREDLLWNYRLADILEKKYPGKWEVLNGGHPGYNSAQHRYLWESGLWNHVKPDLVLLRFGGNDISQAYAMAEKWKPGATWPIRFLWAMNTVQTPFQRLMLKSCVYYMGYGKKLFRRAFGDVVKSFLPENREGVREQLFESYQVFLDLAKVDDIPLAVLSDGSLEHCARTEDDRKALDALNENWRAFAEGYGDCYEQVQEEIQEHCSSQWQVSWLDLQGAVASHPCPGSLFFDGVHWNEEGHKVVADSLFKIVEEQGWWSCD